VVVCLHPELEENKVRVSRRTNNLIEAHVDYVKQFLNNTKTCLSTNIYLHVRYDCLAKATDDFTKDKTQVNCPKIIDLAANDDEIKHLSKLKNYFPHAKIYSFLFII